MKGGYSKVKQFVEKNRKVFYFDTKEYQAPYDFGNTLTNLLEDNAYQTKHLVFLCIGSDRLNCMVFYTVAEKM